MTLTYHSLQPAQRKGREGLCASLDIRLLEQIFEKKKGGAAASEIKDKHWCPQLEILIATEERQW